MVKEKMKGMKSGVVALVVIALCAVATARTEPNSFLNRPASTAQALKTQLMADRQVMDRFMRHFGMTREQVLAMVSDLSLARLPQDGVYLVYNCSENEEIRARVMYYKKGTLVWVDRMGTPVLKASCGNPMVRGSDASGVQPGTATVAPTATAQTRPMAAPGGETIVMSAEVEGAMPGLPEASPLTFNAGAAPLAPTLSSNRGGGIGAFAVLPLVGGLLVSRGRNNPPPPVPEPTSMVALGLGATALVARRRRKS
ncbi:MAG: PEP-CTERM sorting domain-containing protein [Fimbriimonadaceae bacterium]|nr:PEP-CTERM sorting domain-containing protein [Fimbriimonadaceae bacterium]